LNRAKAFKGSFAVALAVRHKASSHVSVCQRWFLIDGVALRDQPR